MHRNHVCHSDLACWVSGACPDKTHLNTAGGNCLSADNEAAAGTQVRAPAHCGTVQALQGALLPAAYLSAAAPGAKLCQELRNQALKGHFFTCVGYHTA